MAQKSGWRRVRAMVLVAVGMSAGTLAAQEARVLGRVTDGVGNPVAAATITLVAEGASQGQTATSGPSGGFQFQGVAPGTYTLRVERAGMQAREQRITVRAGRVVTPVVRLDAAGRTQRGMVAAAPTDR